MGEPRSITFRDAVPADVPVIHALVESAYRGESSRAGWTTEADLLDGQRTDADSILAMLDSPATRVRLGVDADEVLTCCQLEQRGDGVAYFGMFAVSPVLQGGGIGGQLLDEAERLAREEWAAAQMQMTVISVRRDLIAWYERRGYTATGETRPFPHGDERFGLPRRVDLEFAVLAKQLRS